MARDKLFLIQPGFSDPKHPGRTFVCPYCNQVEGMLAAFPDLAARLDVERVPFARPRDKVIDALGERHQSLPVLVIGGDPPTDLPTAKGQAFADDTKCILALLAERHGFPHLHE
ncbi:DUF3088 domain-containing protein [Mesorhizobium sp. M0142]|uniref:DUF3088 domain-containing protein n=1 Tax=unclassified Mesorhizobium TaxID=325217 RepID=UPI0003CF4D8C|nr:DUF3088 domain-containing protein [Mesorhizobium sp. LSHC420B00]ESX82334.1 hypothetical protein X759_06595 [Mesorhizobium sp. LSHC420B00]